MARDPVSAAFIYGLGAAVALAWLASVIGDIVIAPYSTPVALHGIMGTVVGSAFADFRLRNARRKMVELMSDPVNDRRTNEETSSS